MDKKEFSYEIGGKTFIQRPIVIGQTKLLSDLLPDIQLPSAFTVRDVINAVGQEKLPEALAIVLTEAPGAGVKPAPTEEKLYWQRLRDKDIPALAEELINSIEPETVLQVTKDFFDCNPIASFFQMLSGMLENMGKKINGPKISLPSSPGETLPSETKSSGDTPTEIASPTSDIAEEM